MTKGQTTDWHGMSVNAVLDKLHTNLHGLSSEAAAQRLKQYGYNSILSQGQRSWFLRLLSQFNNLLIYVLLGAACIKFFLGKYVDSIVILAVVLINTFIGFIQEGKAEQAILAVSKMLSLQATVVRNGKRITLSAEELVPGDIVVLQSGDKVPADLRLIKVKNLQISEAILTGESTSITKVADECAEQTILPERTNMAYSGTLVTYGHAMGVVVETGEHTEIGEIGKLLAKIPSLSTPLVKKMTTFARWVTIFVLLIAALIFIYGIFVHAYTLDEMFTAAVGIAVAAIPEGLPIILTITLAIGVQRMAQRHAIIRRLPAVETLGSVMIICSDKTGTLTRNEMTVQTVLMANSELSVTGSGYSPRGEFVNGEKLVDYGEDNDLLELCQAAALCNDATFYVEEKEEKLQGDPMEGALLALAMKAGLDYQLLRKEVPLTDAIPFESEHRFMATLHHDHTGKGMIYVKGAPEVILERCYLQRINGEVEPLDHAEWKKQIENMASEGKRMLAIAYKAAPSHQRELQFSDVTNNLILLGIVGISDPPREEVLQALTECKTAGIRIKMITGDHAVTARAIAKQMGIGNGHDVLTGEELDRLNEKEFLNLIDQVDVFARTSPEHKLRLVKNLQAKGYVVAMTGDGVNDAPALKKADIGVAMGLKGTEVAKEASEMVLTDDNFASIVAAVKEGRTVYDNLKKAITFLLPVNGGESLSIVLAVLFGFTLPITAVQILWINMVSSVTLTMALAFEPSEPTVMQRPPVPTNEPLLSKLLIWRIIFVSTVFLLGIFGIFKLGLSKGASLETGRTLAVNTLVVLEICYLFSSRYIHGSSLTWEGIKGTPAVLIAVGIVVFLQLGFTYLPFMQYLFKTAPLNLEQCLWVGLFGIVGFTLLEIEKLFRIYSSKAFGHSSGAVNRQ